MSHLGSGNAVAHLALFSVNFFFIIEVMHIHENILEIVKMKIGIKLKPCITSPPRDNY